MVRSTAASVVHGIPVRAWNAAAGLGAPLLPRRFHLPSFGAKLHAVGDLLSAQDRDDLYVRQMSFWGDDDRVVVGAQQPRTGLTDRDRWPRFGDPIARAMFVDTRTYLPDDILVKVDRASMAASLETQGSAVGPRGGGVRLAGSPCPKKSRPAGGRRCCGGC